MMILHDCISKSLGNTGILLLLDKGGLGTDHYLCLG